MVSPLNISEQLMPFYSNRLDYCENYEKTLRTEYTLKYYASDAADIEELLLSIHNTGASFNWYDFHDMFYIKDKESIFIEYRIEIYPKTIEDKILLELACPINNLFQKTSI